MLVSTELVGKGGVLHVFIFETSENLKRVETGIMMASNCEMEKSDKNPSF